ncbi:MAG TPA: CAP domain-containing protein [Candidatus Sulfotelmatobacter sp.]|jgi:uncharacterized protein YkwD
MLTLSRAIARKAVAALILGTSAAAAPPLVQQTASSEGSSNPAKAGSKATLKPIAATSPDIPFSDFDADSERQLLELVNQARTHVGLPALALDAGLTHAARAHAEAMFTARQLSHQFAGEASLAERLAAATHTQLDQEGENVAFDFDAADAQENLMLSPPHRANLLNSTFNVIGLGIVRSGNRLYIVQDFGHALPTYSTTEVKDRIGAAITRMRHQSGEHGLTQRDLAAADAVACSMAQADKISTASVHQLAQRYSVLSYTTLHPETLPDDANRALRIRNLRGFSVGACYARTESYPTGAYWVVVALD